MITFRNKKAKVKKYPQGYGNRGKDGSECAKPQGIPVGRIG
jgi:hypothetical protein